VGPDVRERFWGKAVTRAQFDAACQLRERFTAWWDALLGDAVLVMPTVPDGAPLLTAQAEEIDGPTPVSRPAVDFRDDPTSAGDAAGRPDGRSAAGHLILGRAAAIVCWWSWPPRLCKETEMSSDVLFTPMTETTDWRINGERYGSR
jgi:hypothetical protein